MKLPLFIQKLFNKVSNAKFFYVTLDVCPDFTTGQGEVCSYTIRSKNRENAIQSAIENAVNEWEVKPSDLYVVDCIETNSPDLIYDMDR